MQEIEWKEDFFADLNDRYCPMPCHFSFEEALEPPSNSRNVSDNLTVKTETPISRRQHTAPKTVLSVLRKILYWDPNTSKKFKQLLSQICKNYNHSTPLKIIELAIKAGLLGILKKKFLQQARKKIFRLAKQNGWSRLRVQVANHWIQKIESVLSEKIGMRRFDLVWQGHNHKGKYFLSLDQVSDFSIKLSSISRSQLRK